MSDRAPSLDEALAVQARQRKAAPTLDEALDVARGLDRQRQDTRAAQRDLLGTPTDERIDALSRAPAPIRHHENRMHAATRRDREDVEAQERRSLLGKIMNYDVFRAAGITKSEAEMIVDASRNDGILDHLDDLVSAGTAGVQGGLSRLSAALALNAQNRAADTNSASRSENVATAPVADEGTWEEFKAHPGIGTLGRFVRDQGARSAPGMALAMMPGGMAAYGASQAGSIGQQRANNNGRDAANLGDVALASPAAALSAYLERLGIEKALTAGGKTVLGRIARGGAGEAATEFLQSGTEYAGGTLGTDAGFQPGEALDQSVAGAVAGFGTGAGLAGAHGAVQAAGRRGRKPGSGISPPDGAGGATSGVDPDAPTPTGPDFYARPDGRARTFATPKQAAVFATANRLAGDYDLHANENGSYSLRRRPSAAVPDEQVLTPGDRASPIPDDVIAAGRRAQAATIDPKAAAATVDAFTADPTNNRVPSPEEAIAALDARRDAPLGQPQPDPIVQPVARSAAAPNAGGDFVDRMVQAESRGNATAKNPLSSATGTGQFIRKTWLSLMRSTRARETAGMSDEQVLALRNNPLISAQMSAVYARQNGDALRRNGHRVDNGTLYLSHFLGAGGANSVLSADPNTPVAQLLGADQIAANKPVLQGKTAGQVIAWAYGKMGEKGATRAAPADIPPAQAAEYETEGVNDFVHRVLGDEDGNGGDVSLEEASDEPLPANATETSTPAPQASASQPTVVAPQRQDVAITSAGREVPVRYRVVEASDLIASNLDDGRVNPRYPAERQPRDRSRDASMTQIQRIAANLDPRRVGPSIDAAAGAPIVSPDNVVESGNGRTLAIQRAYATGGEQIDRYRQFLTDQGYDVSGMRQPVLVRERSGNMSADDVAGFIREANERDTLAYSAPEQTQSDAAAMNDGVLELYRPGDVDSAENRAFVRAFMQGVVGANDQGNMVAGDGTISQQALQRIQGALLYRAFDNERLVSQAFEATDSPITSIAKAMTDVAAVWAKLRAAVKSGVVDPSMDITANLNDAVALIDRARREKRLVSDLVGQQDPFSGAIDPVTEGVLTLFFNGPRFTKPASRARVSQALGYYVDQAMMAAPGGGLFGDQTKPADIINLAKGKTGEATLDLEPAPEQAVTTGSAGRDATPPGGDGGKPVGESVPARDSGEDGQPVAPPVERGRRVEGPRTFAEGSDLATCETTGIDRP